MEKNKILKHVAKINLPTHLIEKKFNFGQSLAHTAILIKKKKETGEFKN